MGYVRRDKIALAGTIGIAIFVMWSVIQGILEQLSGYLNDTTLAYILLPSNPFAFNFKLVLAPPSLANFPVGLMGYDATGRSILSRILYAAPKDALAAILVVTSAIVIGMLLGITAGYIGGWADEVLMRVTDAFLAFPLILLAIALALVLGNGYQVVLVALVVIWWPTYARFFRAQALSLKNRGYVEASRLSGLSSFRIIIRHIFPNSIDPIVAIATLDFGNVVLTYSVLAFLGIGAEVGSPEWGSMSASGLQYVPHVWWFALFPSIAIMAVVVCFSLLGDRIQDLVGGRISY
ncbi:MAG: ABC transporter permease [Nitrososphaerota archaeon]|nr:ABC transporter permease [Nitrososphaerota archaeon]